MKGNKTALLGIVALLLMGIGYLYLAPAKQYSQPLLITIVGGICGLGGYEIKRLREK